MNDRHETRPFLHLSCKSRCIVHSCMQRKSEKIKKKIKKVEPLVKFLEKLW